MAIITLAAASDAGIVEYAGVADPELARRNGMFVAEGRLIVRRVIEAGSYRVRSVLLSRAAHQQLADVLGQLDPDVPVYVCPTSSFREITGFNLHRGCVALVERPPQPDVRDLLAATRLVLMLESIANPDNVGGIFRNAAAFGVGGILLDSTTCDPLYRKAIRTSMGAVLNVPFARGERADVFPAIRALGFTVVALTPEERAEPIDRFAETHSAGRLALVLGNEGAGLSAVADAAADVRVRVPVRREVDSLNVAVAAGIALSRLTRFADVW